MDATTTPGPPVYPLPRTCPFSLAPGYRALQEDEPVARVTMPDGEPAWLLTRHEDVRQVLADSRVSADRTLDGYPLFPGMPSREVMRRDFRGGIMGMDPPEHTVHRRLLLPEFTVRRVQAWRPRVQEVVDACLDAMVAAGPPADLVQALALPVPAQVVCDMLSMPLADRRVVDERARVTLSRDASPEDRAAAAAELREVFAALVASRQDDPGDDLLGRMITSYRAAGLYDPELMARMVGALLSGGHETTASMIALGTTALLAHPDQLARVRADAAAWPRAVEELLRYFTPLAEFSGFRAARDDVEVGGRTIRKGDGIIAHGGAANRDARAFDRPDELDLGRRAHHHVAFGYGVHQCLGQNLARLELEVTYATLFDRLPGLRLAVPVEDLEFKDHLAIYGLHRLPVTW
jgi:cytochrome P450